MISADSDEPDSKNVRRKAKRAEDSRQRESLGRCKRGRGRKERLSGSEFVL
jgi:hypothetical protein